MSVGGRFSLESGERQVAPSLDGIRRDHTIRYEFAIDRIRRLIPALAFGADVFCGVGYGTRMLAEALDCPVLGIDGSAEAIEFGNRHYGSPAVILSHKLFPFTLPCAAFDFLCSIESLEHVTAHEDFLAMLYNGLRPGGVLVVSTPNESVLSLEKNRNPFHTRHFAPEQLAEMATGIGFRMLEQASQDVYVMEQGRVINTLPEDRFEIRPDVVGQFCISVFRKFES